MTQPRKRKSSAAQVPPPSVTTAVPQPPLPQSMMDFMTAHGKNAVDPLSPEGLQLQAQFIASCGQHPLDVLRAEMQNVFNAPKDRISAAKAMLEYGLRKIPSQMELSGRDGESLGQLPPAALKKLSTKELETLMSLLGKMENT